MLVVDAVRSAYAVVVHVDDGHVQRDVDGAVGSDIECPDVARVGESVVDALVHILAVDSLNERQPAGGRVDLRADTCP